MLVFLYFYLSILLDEKGIVFFCLRAPKNETGKRWCQANRPGKYCTYARSNAGLKFLLASPSLLFCTVYELNTVVKSFIVSRSEYVEQRIEF